MQNSRAGFLVLFAKLGPKVLPLIAKIGDNLWAALKSLVGIKGAGLAGSVGLYSYLFTWKMGVCLVLFIGIHEYGHLWAMKRYGIRTRGMFFIPGFGAVAVADENFGSARNEANIALMGPIFGLAGFVTPLLLLYWQTEDPMWAAIASFMTFINLINLFPVLPLDGGRVLKALSYSKNYFASLIITFGVSIVTAVAGTLAGFFLIALMAIVGFYEISSEFGITKRVDKFVRIFKVIGYLAVTYILIVSFWEGVVGGRWWFWSLLLSFVVFCFVLIFIKDVSRLTTERGRLIFLYPLFVLQEFGTGFVQIKRLRKQHIKPIANYDIMPSRQKTGYSTLFVALVLSHVLLIYFLGQLPGIGLASELLK